MQALRKKLVSVLPLRFKLIIKQQLSHFKIALSRLFAGSPLLATLFYTLFSSAFRREQYAVLKGRLAYQQQLAQSRDSSILLRRNIHRLEKGLIMQPRRAVFAEDYITETVAEYAAVCSSIELAELKWATAVLNEYFAVVASTPLIDKAKTKFFAENDKALVRLSAEELPASIPYCYANLPEQQVSFDALWQLMQRRRSVRWFLPQPVEKSLLEQAIAAASLAPSACNRQPYFFVHLNNARAAAEVADFAMGTTGFSGNIPELLVVVGDLSAYPNERDRHVIYIDAALASMQLMLALDTLGLASCPINWPDIEPREQKMAKRLGLKPYQRPVMLIALGYADPAGGIAYSQKKPASSLLQSDPQMPH
ncbi:nitroreductase family protein [Rheinheimera sp.]|uniref:nitroreductase family protein n=1 Tax=Rheinheimera sp. TaxID=1869214 RepID=UPI0027BAEC2B|nr:nitroreductase family protein [Rheinheimera sp.]